MIFSSFRYVFFLFVFVLLMKYVPSQKAKKGLLLVGSYYFYACWDWRFLPLLFVMSVGNYVIGRGLAVSADATHRRRLMAGSLVFNLGILGFFKYFNFFIASANVLLSRASVPLPTLHIILPIAISFITFEVISYTIDVYRDRREATESFWDLALLVAFFPHLIAGPILKPRQFLPQTEAPIVVTWEKVERGIQIFVLGLVKKILVADSLAPFVDRAFSRPEDFSSLTIWLAVIAYALQIFCDFSGYSDMAIGSAYCLGFTIPANFRMPYLACNSTDFWRRWHISLSTWLREYLYIPLGGNRRGKVRQYVNLMLVMLLGGLWHGASWNFVVWGGLHGLGLLVHKAYTESFRKPLPDTPILRGLSWLLTMAFVCLTWVFFRSPNFATSWQIVEKMFRFPAAGTHWYFSALLWCLPFVILAHAVGAKYGERFRLNLTTFTGLFLLFFALLALLFLAPTSSAPFIYFQF